MHNISRRRFLALGVSAAVGAATGCRNGYRVFGYNVGADALYDPNIRTVFVPTFNNRAFQTEPYRGFEVDVTQAVIREIGRTTAFRVTSDVGKADTELQGNVVAILKTILNLNQQNQIREAEIQVWVDVGVARPSRRHHPVEPAQGAAAGAEPAARRRARAVRPERPGAAGPHPARPADAGAHRRHRPADPRAGREQRVRVQDGPRPDRGADRLHDGAEMVGWFRECRCKGIDPQIAQMTQIRSQK
jgi:hypothetical protein